MEPVITNPTTVRTLSYGRQGRYSRIIGCNFSGGQKQAHSEDLFVSTLSTCHMLWYLHLCAVNGVVVLEYIDNATGLMEEESNGSGRFTKVTLSPEVIVSENSMIEKLTNCMARRIECALSPTQ